MINKDQHYIMCAAIHVDDGEQHPHQPKNINSGFVVCGRRHHNCFATIAMCIEREELVLLTQQQKVTQGFLTSYDLFLNRKKSYSIAKSSGQVTDKLIGSILTSEDLY